LVVSITQFYDDNVGNIVPSDVSLQATFRFFDPGLSDHCEQLIGEIPAGIAAAHAVASTLDEKRGYPPVINMPDALVALSRL